jgi:signal transduction histidine kinase
MLSNLLANAVHDGGTNAPVRVTAKTEPSRFMLQVTNSGPPIPDEMREHLFEPFSRKSVADNRDV